MGKGLYFPTPTPIQQKQKNHGLAQGKPQKLERCVVCASGVLKLFCWLSASHHCLEYRTTHQDKQGGLRVILSDPCAQ